MNDVSVALDMLVGSIASPLFLVQRNNDVASHNKLLGNANAKAFLKPAPTKDGNDVQDHGKDLQRVPRF
jgi:hypothetical protein